MTDYRLLYHCGEGVFAGKSMVLEFENESRDQAEEFALGIARLKTWNMQPFKILRAQLYVRKTLFHRIPLPDWELIWEWHR